MTNSTTNEKLTRRIINLEANERRLLDAQKMAHMGHWYWDVETGEVEWSEEVYRIFHLDPEAFTPRIDSIMDLSPWPEDHVRDQELIQRAAENKEQGSYEQRFRRPDGSTGYYYSTFQGIYDEGGLLTAMKGIIQDITERKLAEIALQEREEQLSLALTVSGAGIWRWQLKEERLFVDERFLLLLGYPPGEIPSPANDWIAWHHSHEFDAVTHRLRADIDARTPFSDNEFRILCKDGRYRWLHIRGRVTDWDESRNPEWFMGVAMDVTERKRAEEKLAEASTIINKSSTVAFTWRKREGWPVEYVSENVAKVFGYSAEDFTSGAVSYERCVHADDLPRLAGEVSKYSREEGRTEFIHEPYRIVAKDGVEKTVSDWTCLIRNEAGEVVAYKGLVEDITDRIQAEQEHNRLVAQLHQAQKMEAVGQLAGGVAHDFNNILQAIFGYGEIAQGYTEEDHPGRASIDGILIAAERAETLVKQLLAFSRRQVLDMKDIDLNDVISDVVRMIHRIIGEHIALDVLLGHKLGTVRADVGQISQIVTNLCVNARDAMPDGGIITIETENVRIDREYCETHAWASPGRFVLIRVTDTGCGMDEDTIAQIFEPFFSTKEKGKGSGLGLSTVYGLVRQHEGMIHVYSELGKGTTFKIYIPIVERSATSVGSAVEGPVSGGTETILLAEDDDMVRESCRELLEHVGYSVMVASTGEEALRVIEAHADVIDLALLDVVMPGLGGRAVYDRIKERFPHMPVLFSSGYSANAIHTGFILDQGLTLIQKPYQRAELLRKIRQVLGRD